MGVTCRLCNWKEFYWLENKQAYECMRCHACQTLRSGTVTQHSSLLYRYWFVAILIQLQRDKPLKCGRGSQKKTKVQVMAKSKTVENPNTVKKPKKIRYLKMKVISDLKSETITKNVKEHIGNTTDLTTDDSTSYTKLEEHVHSQTASVIPKE